MNKTNVPLLEVDEVKITIIMDNTVDLLMASSEVAARPYLSNQRTPPVAEHGFSALIEVKCGDQSGTVLLDAGISPNGVLHNMSSLEVDLAKIEAIIISHGHGDHTLGLPKLIERLGSQKISLVYHSDAFSERKIAMPNGHEVDISPPKLAELRRENITFVEKDDPTLMIHNMMLVSGEVERTTDFETGFPIHYTKRNGEWVNDPLIKDDQSVIVNVRGKGLVIIAGCSHSGVINSIRYAQALTGIQQVHAVLGGFHLTGAIFESRIPATVEAMQKINPTYLMPCHCTGWVAIHQFAKMMPQAFIPANVGTTLVF